MSTKRHKNAPEKPAATGALVPRVTSFTDLVELELAALTEEQTCGCGATVKMTRDGLMMWAQANVMLQAERMLRLRAHEVAKCRSCFLLWKRDQINRGDYEFAEFVSAWRDLVTGRVVEQDRMARVMAGGYAHSMRLFLEQRAMLQSGGASRTTRRRAVPD